MAREKENECRGCAECIGCGRKYEYFVNLICDKCGEEYCDYLWEVDKQELCTDCAFNAIEDRESVVSEFYSRIDGDDEREDW